MIGTGRLPTALIALCLLLAVLGSGGAFLVVVALWLMWRSRRRGQLKSCLGVGCCAWILLAAAVAIWGTA